MRKLEYVAKLHRKNNIAYPPLWFTEGIAEYWSDGWDSEADMFLRDMTISGNIISVNNLYSISGSFLMYKVGQSIMKYIGDTYGDDMLTDLFDNWWRGKTFDENIKITYGKTFKELGAEWEYYLKKKYYPYLEAQELPDRVAKKLTNEGFNMKPSVFLKDTKKGRKEFIAFKTYRLGYSIIAEMPLTNGDKEHYKSIIKGGRSEEFESLHMVDSGLDVNIDGLIAFASKTEETDALYIYDTRKGKIIEKIKNRNLILISSPSWSPESDRIVFEGIDKSGNSDLYIYNFPNEEFTRLTNDIYIDKDPSFSRTDGLIAFSSDRNADGRQGVRNLFLYDLHTNEITRLTTGDQLDESPKWMKTGDRIIYTSDRSGANNVFIIEGVTNGHKVSKQMTDFVTGAFDPVMANFDSTVVFTAYQNFGYHIYKMNLPDEPVAIFEEPESWDYWQIADSWDFPKLSGESTPTSVKYNTQMSFDIAQSSVAYDGIVGTMGGLQLAMTDILGNHQWYFLLYNTANTRSDFLGSTNAAASYMNKTKRINYGGGLFHFYHEYTDGYNGFINERTYGGLMTASYPISRYRRFESSMYFRRLEKVTTFDFRPDTKVTLGTFLLSYIKDTSIWDPTGPIDGTRINIGMLQSINLDGIKYYNSTYNFDFRKYFRLGQSSAFASRFMFLRSVGEDPQRFYLGGSWSLRGYPRRAFYGRNLMLLNNELRFPLVNDLYVGFPFGALRFQAIRGALFFDAGKVWEDDFNKRSFRYAETDGFEGSIGFGFRVSLGNVAVLRFDFARPTDFQSVKNNYDFDFFFGWNF
jgi:hypothetical protein